MTSDNQALQKLAEGKRLFEVEDFEGALECFNECIQLTSDPMTLGSPRLNRAETLKRLGREEEEESVARHPPDDRQTRATAEDKFAEGLQHFGQQEFEQAIASFDEVLRLSPNHRTLTSTYLNRSEALTKPGRFEEAAADKEQWDSLRQTAPPVSVAQGRGSKVEASGDIAYFDHDVTGWRIVAAFVDFIPITILLFILAAFLGETESEGGSFSATLNDTGTVILFLALALLYYMLLEVVTGTTLGKMLLGLRVVKLDETPYRWNSAVIRNILRAIDALLTLYLAGIVSIGMTTWNQRLGDRAANTLVVRVLPYREEISDPSREDWATLPRPTDNRWKISTAPKMVVGLLIFGLISGLAIFVYPEDDQGTVAGLPSRSEALASIPSDQDLQSLARETLLEFDRGIAAKDMTSFYNSISQLWQNQTSVNDFDEAFRTFIVLELSIAGIAGVPAIFDPPRFVDKNALLNLSGYYSTTPSRVLFDLKYIYERPDWKLAEISLNLTP